MPRSVGNQRKQTIIRDDMNAKSPSWGSKNDDAREAIITN